MTRSLLPRRLAFLIAATSALTLAACTADDPATAPLPTVTVEELAVPEGMLASKSWVQLSGGILPATDALPYAAGGAAAEPGAGGTATVWLSRDGQDWDAVEVDPDAQGAFSGSLAGTDTLAALVGTLWHEGTLTTVLWTSEDRENWERVELPKDFAASIRVTGVTVDASGRILLVGTDYQHKPRGIVIDDGDVTEMELPETGEEHLNPGSIAAGGESAVMIAMPAAEGEIAPLVAYRSADGGATWQAANEVAPERSGVYNVVWTGQHFVATGYTPANSTPAAQSAPAAWSSPDGATWTAETVPEPEEYYTSNDDVWLGEPSVANGVVSTIGGNDNQAYSAAYERSANGQWSVTGYTSLHSRNGDDGRSVSVGDGSTIGLVGSAGAVRAGTLAGGNWTDSAVLSEREDLLWVREVLDQSDGALVSLGLSHFAIQAGGLWRNWSTSSTARYDLGDTVETVPADPARLDELSSIVRSSDPDAGELVIGSSFPADADAILLEGYFRPSSDAEWVPMSGFPADGSTWITGLTHTESGWIAVGEHRVDTLVSSPNHGAIWTSADGISWAPALGYFGSGELETSISDVCQLPDGTPIALGSAEAQNGNSHAVAWSYDWTSWTRLDVGDLDQRRGWFSSCADSPEGLVASATIGGRDLLLRTENGSEWETVFEAEDGVSLHSPVAVEGGFAAAGGWSNSERSGPVVWVSKDGGSWSPLAVPSRTAGTTSVVAAVGSDLVVAMPALVGHPLLVIRDIAEVVAEHAE